VFHANGSGKTRKRSRRMEGGDYKAAASQLIDDLYDYK
jgi:hypothetical protein